MLSGRLFERFELHVIDAIADRIGQQDCITLIEKITPDVVIALIGAVSLDEDCAFLAKLKRPERRIVVSGDSVVDDAEAWLHGHPYVDAVLRDFTSRDTARDRSAAETQTADERRV